MVFRVGPRAGTGPRGARAAPVAAKVVKGSNRTDFVTQDHCPRISHVKSDIGARFGKVADMTGKLPMRTKN